MSETRHNGLYWEHEVGNGVKAAVSFAGGEWQAYVIVSKRDGSLLKFSHVGGSKLERDARTLARVHAEISWREEMQRKGLPC